MPISTRAGRRLAPLLAGSLGLAALATGVGTAPAYAVSTGLVISEVYGGGGNSGASYTHDFIELFNPTDEAISVDGWSVQYRSASSTSTAQTTPLTGSVPAGEHYLVRGAGGSTGAELPAPQASGSLNLSATNGQVFLVDSTAGLTPADVPAGSVAGSQAFVDMVGYGTANVFETTAAPSPGGNVASLSRGDETSDTDVNSADFSVTQSPTPSAATAEPEPEPEPTAVSIPEIQGDGATSPLDGDAVTTTGVVTAAPQYLYGFYVQDPEGDGDAATSDAVFVYYPQGSGSITVEPGDHVEVTGEVDEYAGQTQVVSSAAGTVELNEAAGPVEAYAGEWPATDAAKESLEGMLFSPQGEFTVTNTYSTNQYGEVGLAVGDKPLIQPTEVADAQDTDAIAAVEADNDARAITLDDASSTTYTSNSSLTPPYVSNEAPVRVGASATFTEDVILTQGGSPSSPTYRFQPLVTVSGPDYTATSPATFENTRTEAPDAEQLAADGTPDLKVASFNVLNYFTTLGDADDDNVGDDGCTSYNDRDGDGTTVRGGCDLRGAWDPQDLARQQEKIVAAINALDADVVGLMEIENSAALGEEADEATQTLVDALNADAGEGTWAATPSSDELPAASEQDVITNALIYKPAAVERVGEARALGDQSASGQAFGNAREPIGQVFAPVGGGEDVLVVVNHFKSKGSGTDDGTGQGNANPDRVAQATALEEWVPTVQDETGTEAVLLVGDFNSYSMEDPMQVLYEGGYTNVQELSPVQEWSYSFSGLSGSLDHVLANDAALELVTGTDIWNINSGESIALEYSRFNIHGTDFHAPGPFRSSDHDPVVVGLDATADAPELLDADIAVKVAPKRPRAGQHRATFKVVVTAEGATPGGQVVVDLPGKQDLVGELNAAGKVVLKMVKPFGNAGEKTVVVSYAGDDSVAPADLTTTLEVREPKKNKKK
ncbi:hypothetical protein NOK12_08440 [Nocardioides sp. OK12]|uniref:ExeM/NucH family extracellular endonuclease n=1 Tax=Nocardioides sp. OK12 TaxID=2758661 RepID=UPI0021C25A14|nr:ExeM/NucH family extracellular endonuclease [Nocardioides sp. OK12]GHJ58325.1 hypothetical protein NOK12_08440 [Nocardioides sp. OK12]